MLAKDQTRSGFSAELRIIPNWAWIVAGILFVAAQIGFYFLSRLENTPPAWAMVLFGLLAGAVLSSVLLLVAYINRDAKRRGMSPVLWTIVAIVIPHALGVILYFVLRQPLRSTCPQCGTAIESGFNFCPRCNCKVSPSCPQCQRLVGAGDIYCPYCGTSLRTQSGPAGSQKSS